MDSLELSTYLDELIPWLERDLEPTPRTSWERWIVEDLLRRAIALRVTL